MMRPERTQYPEYFGRVYHIIPDGGDPGSVRAKYGPFVSHFRDIGDTLAKMNPGDGMAIWPGAHSTTIAAGIPITKNRVTIFGIGSRWGTSIAHGAGTDVGFLVTGNGVTIRNLTFGGADADVKGISFAGQGGTIEDCYFPDSKLAISGTGANWLIQRNFIESDNTAAIGVDLLAAASRCQVSDNIIALSGGTGDVGIKVNNTALLCAVYRNAIGAGVSDAISLGSGGTLVWANMTSGSATADGELIAD